MKYLEVAAAFVREKDKFMLCQRKEDDSFGLLWEFPGGKVEKGETLEEAVKREIKEEIALSVAPLRAIGVFNDTKDDFTIKVHLFECVIESGEPLPLECRDIKFITIEEIDRFNLAPVDKKIALYLKNSLMS